MTVPYGTDVRPPVCPKCRREMGKAGSSLSGYNKVQRWKCTCGKTTIIENLGRV